MYHTHSTWKTCMWIPCAYPNQRVHTRDHNNTTKALGTQNQEKKEELSRKTFPPRHDFLLGHPATRHLLGVTLRHRIFWGHPPKPHLLETPSDTISLGLQTFQLTGVVISSFEQPHSTHATLSCNSAFIRTVSYLAPRVDADDSGCGCVGVSDYFVPTPS